MENWYKKGTALAEEIQSTALPRGELALWFIGQCGFILKHLDKVIMIDPVLNDITDDSGCTVKHYEIPFLPDAVKPDYVFCTHGHIDHMAGETVSGIAQAFPDAKFVIPVGCVSTALECGLPMERLIPVADGCKQELCGEIGIQAFSAAHPTHALDVKDPAMALGYCITLGGIRVVHLGDTYLTQRLLQSLESMDAPHIFLPPINGDDLFRAMRDCIGNMETEEAAKLAVRLHADLSIPTHYDMIQGNNVDPLRFAAELRRLSPTAKWHIPALGERVLYRM